MKLFRNISFFLLSACCAQISANDEIAEKLPQIQLPTGFEIHLYAEGVTNARQLALGDHGTVFAGSRKAGLVHAVVDRDGDHFAERVYVIDEDLEVPSDVEFRFGSLYVGALGLTFYTGSMFPKSYVNQLFIAQHGSWNRSEKSGYNILLVRFDDDGNITGSEVFASGWLQGQDNWGRPSDVLQMPDGSLLIPDDQAGVIYRITWTGQPQ